MAKKRAVLMVTAPAGVMKRSFTKLFPDKSAQEVYPLWLKFWGGIAQSQSVKVEYVTPPETPSESEPMLPLSETGFDDAEDAAAARDLERLTAGAKSGEKL